MQCLNSSKVGKDGGGEAGWGLMVVRQNKCEGQLSLILKNIPSISMRLSLITWTSFSCKVGLLVQIASSVERQTAHKKKKSSCNDSTSR